ncbi:PKD domain-containing protein, partial [Actinomadura sp. KC345]|uniref:PKD domain-containing protein n=1 Tax=Actinomadura sp. KC345 TaxID=2530371 RepID=UPI001A9DE1B6
ASPAHDAAAHIVGYDGELQQALLYLDAWVARGSRPPATTGYHVDSDSQVRLAPTAARRHGLQPVATLRVRPGAHPAGRPVTFSLRAQVPPGTGKIVRVEWDFQGTGTFTAAPPPNRPAIHRRTTHTFTKPGTYHTVARVTAQHNGDPHSPYGLIQNLAAVRVTVR